MFSFLFFDRVVDQCLHTMEGAWWGPYWPSFLRLAWEDLISPGMSCSLPLFISSVSFMFRFLPLISYSFLCLFLSPFFLPLSPSHLYHQGPLRANEGLRRLHHNDYLNLGWIEGIILFLPFLLSRLVFVSLLLLSSLLSSLFSLLSLSLLSSLFSVLSP